MASDNTQNCELLFTLPFFLFRFENFKRSFWLDQKIDIISRFDNSKGSTVLLLFLN